MPKFSARRSTHGRVRRGAAAAAFVALAITVMSGCLAAGAPGFVAAVHTEVPTVPFQGNEFTSDAFTHLIEADELVKFNEADTLVKQSTCIVIKCYLYGEAGFEFSTPFLRTGTTYQQPLIAYAQTPGPHRWELQAYECVFASGVSCRFTATLKHYDYFTIGPEIKAGQAAPAQTGASPLPSISEQPVPSPITTFLGH